MPRGLKLGHDLEHTLKNPATTLHQGPFLPCSNNFVPSEASLRTLKCATCLAAKARSRGPGSRAALSEPKRQARYSKVKRGLNGFCMVLKQGDLRLGDCSSTDHFFSPATGRLLESNTSTGYNCGSIFVDHASGQVFVFPQFSSDAPETIDNKATIDGVHIRKYHSDNGTFASKAIKEDCKLQSQTYDFSAPYAHFQNRVAEQGIQTVIRGPGQIFYMLLFIGQRVLTLVSSLLLSSMQCGCSTVFQTYPPVSARWSSGQASAKPTTNSGKPMRLAVLSLSLTVMLLTARRS